MTTIPMLQSQNHFEIWVAVIIVIYEPVVFAILLVAVDLGTV